MAAKRMDEATRKRVRAGRLLQKGKRPAEIALDVGVARQTLHTGKPEDHQYPLTGEPIS